MLLSQQSTCTHAKRNLVKHTRYVAKKLGFSSRYKANPVPPNTPPQIRKMTSSLYDVKEVRFLRKADNDLISLWYFPQCGLAKKNSPSRNVYLGCIFGALHKSSFLVAADHSVTGGGFHLQRLKSTRFCLSQPWAFSLKIDRPRMNLSCGDFNWALLNSGRFSARRMQHDKFHLRLEVGGKVWLLNPLHGAI